MRKILVGAPAVALAMVEVVAGQWSRQAACWPNVVSYGYSLRS
ncbi:hypothetical protein SAMN04515680_2802 [Leifsonia sp. 21MFCrub1.1]|nr:hypothetical protein SAMN04515680_2802 [Leifsonia sp. 21MFCrub1.1]